MSFDNNLVNVAQQLRKAMRGMGTDEAAIISITKSYNNSQRQQIKLAYKSSLGRDLIEDFKSELSGYFLKVVVAMYSSPAEFDSRELYEAFSGMGTNENAVIEVLGTRDNKRISEIKQIYQLTYGESLEKRIISETSSNFQKMLVSLVQCARSENQNLDPRLVEQDVADLYKAGEGKWGTDETTFRSIFALRSSAHLRAVNDSYSKNYGKPLISVVESEFSGDIKNLLKTIIHFHSNPVDYYVTKINKACRGMGTNDDSLVRNLVQTDENLLPQIKKAYLQKFSISIEQQIRNETSGDYETMLLGLVEDNCSQGYGVPQNNFQVSQGLQNNVSQNTNQNYNCNQNFNNSNYTQTNPGYNVNMNLQGMNTNINNNNNNINSQQFYGTYPNFNNNSLTNNMNNNSQPKNFVPNNNFNNNMNTSNQGLNNQNPGYSNNMNSQNLNYNNMNTFNQGLNNQNPGYSKNMNNQNFNYNNMNNQNFTNQSQEYYSNMNFNNQTNQYCGINMNTNMNYSNVGYNGEYSNFNQNQSNFNYNPYDQGQGTNPNNMNMNYMNMNFNQNNNFNNMGK